MPNTQQLQTNFTSGALDPKLAAREDIKFYFNGLEEIKNMLPLPTGGCQRRAGLEYVDTISHDTSEFDSDGDVHFQVIPFLFSDTEQYIMVLGHNGTDGKLWIYLDDELDDNVTTPYSAAEVEDVHWTQSLDTLILVHEDYQPRKVVRSGGSFSISKLSLSNIPQHDFSDGSSPSSQNEKQRIEFSNMSSGDPYDLELEGETTQEIQYENDDATNKDNIKNSLSRLDNTSEGDFSVSTNSAASSGSAKYDVEFTGDNGDKPWDNIIPLVLAGTGEIAVSEQQAGSGGEEDVWSATRGWPRTATFYQSRLYFGGSKSRPQTVWGSVIGDFFNFNEGRNLADEAINITADTDTVSEVRAIFPGRNLEIFTSSGEFFIPEEPITPNNVRMRRATRNGIRPNMNPVESDGAVLYMQEGGKSLQEFIFSETEQSFRSNNISLLSSHLFNKPQDMHLRPSSETDEADLVFVVNQGGSMATLSRLRNQEITAFSNLGTHGQFDAVGVLDFDPYFIVQRDISANAPATGQPVFHLEKWNDKRFLDASSRFTFPNTLDDFEDGNISEYGGDTGSFNVQQSTVLEGDDTLEGTGAGVISDTGVTVFQGMELDCLIQGKSGGEVGFLYGTDSQSGEGSVSGYEVVVDIDNDKVVLYRVDSGSTTKLLEKSSSEALDNSTNYRIVVRWDDSDEHFIFLEKEDGTELASTNSLDAVSDNNYTSGGIGFHSPSGGGFFDIYRIRAQKVFKSNLTHLNGEEIQVYADGMNLSNVTPSSGEATIDRYASEHCEFGFNFDPVPTMKTMPLAVDLPVGSAMNSKKRIVELMLRLHQTKALSVNGSPVPFRQYGSNFLDTEIPTFTGDKELGPILGWDNRAQITITQPEPQPLTVLGIWMKVAVAPG